MSWLFTSARSEISPKPHCANGLKPSSPSETVQENGRSELKKKLWTWWKKTTSELKSYFYLFNPVCILRGVKCQNEFISFLFFRRRQKFLLQVAPGPSKGQCIMQILLFSYDVYSLV